MNYPWLRVVAHSNLQLSKYALQGHKITTVKNIDHVQCHTLSNAGVIFQLHSLEPNMGLSPYVAGNYCEDSNIKFLVITCG